METKSSESCQILGLTNSPSETAAKSILGSPKYPLDLFPIEVWEQIFDHLTDATDLKACLNTTSVWREALKLKVSILIFSEVLPYLTKYISHKDIINCRLVCQHWRSSVDTFLSNHLCHFKLDGHNYKDDDRDDDDEEAMERWHKYMYWFHSPTDIQTFLQRMENHAGYNPFINRRVVIHFNEFPYGPQVPEMWNNVESLLKTYGENVWYFTITLFCNWPPDRFYRMLQQYFNLMPNLKVVYIDFNSGIQNMYYLKTLEEVVETLPFPDLPHLMKFRSGALPNHILNEALRKYNHIQRLHMQKPLYIADDCRYYDYKVDMQLLNLKELAQPIHYMYCLSMLAKVSWQLETLTLANFNTECVDLSTMLDTLSRCKFAKRLRYLNLNLNEPRKKKGPKIENVNFPNLQKLRIFAVGVNHLENIDFLLQLPGLQELVLILEDCDTLNEAEQLIQLIQFRNYYANLYASNIWSLLPKLQSVFIKTKCNVSVNEFDYRQFYYTRRKYREICKNNSSSPN